MERKGEEVYLLGDQGEETVLESTDDGTVIHFIRKGENMTSLPSAVFNLANTIIGAGVLALPFAFKNTGIVFGPLLLIGIYSLVVYSCYSLVQCAKLSKGYSYSDVAYQAFGNAGVRVSQVCLIVSTFGAGISYLVIFGDMLAPMIGDWMGGTNDDFCSVYADRRLSIAACLVVVCPLCMLKHLNSLKYVSYLVLVRVLCLLNFSHSSEFHCPFTCSFIHSMFCFVFALLTGFVETHRRL
eukprot:m.74606 g.74606  ORF g.74606 m.74606 type:complete len:240 (+) comp11813_c0_seq2:110-829(+)